MFERYSKFSAELESIVSKLSRKVYADSSLVILDHDELDKFCASNGVEIDALFVLEIQLELQHLRDELPCHASKVAEDNFRSLSVALHSVLGVSRFLFVEKLAAVSESYVEAVSMISKATISFGEAYRLSAAVEYAVKTMSLILDQVLGETIEYLYCFQDQRK